MMVPGAGIEPARLFRARDFKSLVSTNFTTRAKCEVQNLLRCVFYHCIKIFIQPIKK